MSVLFIDHHRTSLNYVQQEHNFYKNMIQT
jgi:hypothetical protein